MSNLASRLATALGMALGRGVDGAAAETAAITDTAATARQTPQDGAQSTGRAAERRPRRAGAHETALGIVAVLLEQGFGGYPLLPADIDAAAETWAAAEGVQPAPASIVREAVAALPQVQRSRPRLSASNSQHRALAIRLRALGKPTDRVTIFSISSHEQLPVGVITASAAESGAHENGRTKLLVGVIPDRRGGRRAGMIERAAA